MVDTVHWTWICGGEVLGSVVITTCKVSKPFEKGKASVEISPPGSDATTTIGVTTVEPVKGRERRNTPRTSNVRRYRLSEILNRPMFPSPFSALYASLRFFAEIL
jgi:hypothetical protein